MSVLTGTEIEQTVLDCMTRLNELREPQDRLAVAPDAPIFGGDSPLDSLGLVTLMMDIEDALAERGTEISLSDAQAMSQRRSPYRDVPTLVGFIEEKLVASG
ncbi:hypothetical protein Enr13x_31020 [Stieleria neptunia]|uniref:Carrier domain-containing protein n=1 Tax=Stieleria neptunia TaxID=2527979 RepID=A0A518HR05_9BACT|nr:hypothetical protein [Stieleria neptunia]QDV43247.1 hypothetical protein Enr13x_31020 [Stieleria neptunia]